MAGLVPVGLKLFVVHDVTPRMSRYFRGCFRDEISAGNDISKGMGLNVYIGLF